MTDLAGVSARDLALTQIDRWRGACMDLFAKSEAATGSALEAAFATGKAARPKHLNGQRLVDLESLALEYGGRDWDKAALRQAFTEWREVENRRPFLAHGVATHLIDNQLRWYAVFDFTTYRTDGPRAERWHVSESEAAEFESRLRRASDTLRHELAKLTILLGA